MWKEGFVTIFWVTSGYFPVGTDEKLLTSISTVGVQVEFGLISTTRTPGIELPRAPQGVWRATEEAAPFIGFFRKYSKLIIEEILHI
jgi:hypothetical protein